jgi:hypothetical protein
MNHYKHFMTTKAYLLIWAFAQILFLKLHKAKHYKATIEALGTTDNYNTEYTERLHIDLAKDAHCATNHKDEFTQMTKWLENKEKIFFHDKFIQWRLAGEPPPTDTTWHPPAFAHCPCIQMTVHPSVWGVPLSKVYWIKLPDSVSEEGYPFRPDPR